MPNHKDKYKITDNDHIRSFYNIYISDVDNVFLNWFIMVQYV